MIATGIRVGVNVYQIIETVALSLGLPMLIPVIIGPAYQIVDVDDGLAGSYNAIEVTYLYPDLIGGALPDPESVVVYGRFRDKPIEELLDTEFTADENGITVNAGLVDSEGRLYTAMYIGYRAFRVDLGEEPREVRHIEEIQSVVGTITLQNPLAYGANKCALGTLYSFLVLGVNTDNELGYQHALEVMESHECYFMVPLTRNPAIIQYFVDHVDQMSAPTERRERIVLGTVGLITEEIRVEAGITGAFANADDKFIDPNQDFYDDEVQPGDKIIIDPDIFVTGSDGDVSVSTDVFESLASDFVTDGVQAGDYLYIAIGLSAGYRQVLSVIDLNNLQLDSVFANTETNITFEISKWGPNGGEKQVNNVIDANTIQVLGNFTATGSLVKYAIEDTFATDKYKQATALKTYAESFANDRLCILWPDVVETFDNNVEVEIESYYLACYLAGRGSQESPDQPFANLPMGGGFTGVKHSNNYFSETQLRTITSGGIFAFEQEVRDAPIKARRQYTTDTSDIKLREWSIRKAVDWGAKFYRLNLKHLVGIFNITPNYLRRLSIAVEGLNAYVTHPVKGVFNYVEMRGIAQDEIELDHVKVELGIGVRYPANEIDIYFYL